MNKAFQIKPVLLTIIFFWITGCADERNPTAVDYGLPIREYKSRLKASNPDSWKRVKLEVKVPTGGVLLSDESLFKTALERNVNYLLHSFSVDHMLEPFKIRGDIPFTPDTLQQIPFWDTKLRGSNAGRFLMGAGNTLRWTHNAQLQDLLNELIDGIYQCRETNGYILPYKPDSLVSEEPNYARAWLTHGLIDAGIYGNKLAYSLLRGQADLFNKWDTIHPKLLYWNFNNHQGHIASTRTYLSPVGKPEDLKIAEKYYVCDWWIDELTSRHDSAIWQYPLQNPHSYLITSFEAYLDHYIATGDRSYLEAMLGAWELIHDKWEHVGGSIAICESHWQETDGKRVLKHRDKNSHPPNSYSLTPIGHTGETCGSSFWIKFNQRLHLLFPNQEKYINEIEKSIYNVILAAQTSEGRIRYHAAMEGTKGMPGISNTCCEGQGTRSLGALPEYIYSIASDGLYINLYEPSEIEWKVDGQFFNLKLKSEFPFKPEIDIIVTTSSPVDMNIRIRIPSWATNEIDILINGTKSVSGKPGNYASLSRRWQTGDRINFKLPMALRTTVYNGADSIPYYDRAAVEFGPILLAALGKGDNPPIISTLNELKNSLVADPRKPLHFLVDGNPNFEFVPYWLVEPKQIFATFPIINIQSDSGSETSIIFSKGFKTSLYNNAEFKGEPIIKESVAKIDFDSDNNEMMLPKSSKVNIWNFSSIFEGEFTAPRSGMAAFFINSNNWYQLHLDGKPLLESKYYAGYRIWFISIEKGEKYRIKLEHKQTKGNYKIRLQGIFI